MKPLPALTPQLAETYARIALAGIGREWPHHYQLLANGPRDLRRPKALHPAFYGCYDWHSAVHSHWMLARLRRWFPRERWTRRIEAQFDRHLTRRAIAAEVRYFQAPGRSGFERPYGWGWLLALAGELRMGEDAASRRWAKAIEPLERLVAERFCEWLPRLRQPIRVGMHANTAFGMMLAFDWARGWAMAEAPFGRSRETSGGDAASTKQSNVVGSDAALKLQLAGVINQRARVFFGGDIALAAGLEPSGADFLSPTLTEADLMRRVLTPAEYARWRRRYLPRLPAALARPADPGKWRDAQSIHLDGLNLSRAWALAGLGWTAAARAHARAGLARVSSGDYLGEHWLASFAVYLLTGAGA